MLSGQSVCSSSLTIQVQVSRTQVRAGHSSTSVCNPSTTLLRRWEAETEESSEACRPTNLAASSGQKKSYLITKWKMNTSPQGYPLISTRASTRTLMAHISLLVMSSLLLFLPALDSSKFPSLCSPSCLQQTPSLQPYLQVSPRSGSRSSLRSTLSALRGQGLY